jgi:hypothetical protein
MLPPDPGQTTSPVSSEPQPASVRPTFASVAGDAARVLTFRRPSSAIGTHWPAYLAFGLGFTWLAGIGRYWDNPRAHLWQHAGLGSLAYVLCLALVLWVLLAPLRPQRWSYRNVLVFVALTSPPALLYAVPVERFMSLEAAQLANAWFLGVVATWRVALLGWYLRASAGLSAIAVVVATLLPLVLIVFVLTLLNLEHVAFDLMAGIRPEERSANDTAYTVVMMLTYFSMLASPVLLLAYIGLSIRAWRRR